MKRKGEAVSKEEEEEEPRVKKRYILSSCKVVEYLGPLMSKDLLFKFPDNSAFDFDYSQSSIWSPLVPRLHSPMDLSDSHLLTPKKLTFGFGFHLGHKNNNHRNCSSSKKVKMIKKKKKIVGVGPEFSPAPIKGACVPFATKGWNKVLKAASKHFKKNKKRDSTGHVKLSNYLIDFKN